jgi:hypothetical protein
MHRHLYPGVFALSFAKVTNSIKPVTSLVVYWSAFLISNYEVPGSIPDCTMGIFSLIGEDPMVWVVSRI